LFFPPKVISHDGPCDAVELRTITVVIVRHFLPIEGGDAGVLILQHLLTNMTLDEIATDIRWEVEARGEFLFDTL
jgi:hypothetical protein